MNTPFSTDAMAVFMESVSLLVKGIMGLFVFMMIFYLLIKILNKLYNNDNKENS